jgi:hypothetical protein
LTVWGDTKGGYNFADLEKYLSVFENKGKSKEGKEKDNNGKKEGFKEGSKKKKSEKSGSSKK